MPQGSASYPAEAHAAIEDKWLNDNASIANQVFDCRYPDGDPDHVPGSTGVGFSPRAIMINGNNTSGEGLGYNGVIRGYLWAENPARVDDYYIAAGTAHPLRFMKIYAEGTTARGIKILY